MTASGAPARAGRARPARSASTAASRRRATQQLRALAHPLRLRLLEAFAHGRHTTMQVAAQLGEPPTRLYHHVNALERAGILKMVDTRQVRGTTEKYFEVASKQIGGMSGEQLTATNRESMSGIAAAIFDEARAELLAAMADPSKLTPATAPIALRMLLSLPPAKIPVLRRRLLAVLRELRREAKKESRSAERVPWALTLAFAPRIPGKK